MKKNQVLTYQILYKFIFALTRVSKKINSNSVVGDLPLKLLNSGRTNLAFAGFVAAIKQEPTRDWIGYFKFWQYVEKNHQSPEFIWSDIILETLDDLVCRYPDNSNCVLNLAEAFMRIGKFNSSRFWYKKAVQINLSNQRPDLISIYSKSTELKPPRPTFTIIGVMKCGTTALYYYFSQHPYIFPTVRKELDFWSWKYRRGLDWYLAHFAELPKSGHYITGEGSPTYFQHRQAPRRLFDAYPDMKIIVLLRSPVERSLSHYHHFKRRGLEHRTFFEAFNAHHDQFLKGEYEPDKLNNYFVSSLYEMALERWFNTFPHEQIHVMFSKELFQDPQQSVNKVCDFLGLSSYTLKEPINPNPGHYQPISPELRAELEQMFIPYNQRLTQLLRQPLPPEQFLI